MSGNEQAYAGLADPSTGMGEYNRLEFLVRMALNRVVTMTLVKVMAVNGDLIDIQPMVAQLDGAGNKTDHGTIHGVPFFRYQAGLNAVILDPVVGDIGIAVFAHNDISGVKATKAPNVPGSRRKFDWADAVYIGGVLNATATQFIRIDDDGVAITSTGEVGITAPDGATVTGDLAVTAKFGANGAAPVAKQTLPAVLAPTATNAELATAYNSLRALAIAFGLGSSGAG